MELVCSKHCRLQQPRVSVKLDFRYETLKKEIELNSFFYKLKIGCSKKNTGIFFRENPFEQHKDKPGFKQPLNQRDGKIKNNKFYRRVPKFLFHSFLPPERNYDIVLNKRYLELGARSLLRTTYTPQHIKADTHEGFCSRSIGSRLILHVSVYTRERFQVRSICSGSLLQNV